MVITSLVSVAKPIDSLRRDPDAPDSPKPELLRKTSQIAVMLSETLLKLCSTVL